MRAALVVSVLIVGLSHGLFAQAEMGTQISSLSFVDRLHGVRDLSAFAESRALVVMFVGTECPMARRYLPRLIALEREYRARGVSFLALDPVSADTPLQIAAFGLEHGVPFPLARDPRGRAAALLGVTRLAEVVVLDAERRLVYRGHVDGRYRFSGTAPEVGREDLKEAIEDVLAVRTVRVPTTAVDGCVLPPPVEDPPRDVTYHQDVAPLLAAHCLRCHGVDSKSSVRLDTLEGARRSAGMVAEVIEQHRMPPWFADPALDHFGNAPTLREDERRQLLDWVRRGTPAGEPASALPPPRADSANAIPADLVLTATRDCVIPAEGYVPYQIILFEQVFEGDTHFEFVGIRSDAPKLLHHAHLFFLAPGRSFSAEGYVMSLVPGTDHLEMPSGVALRIPSGSKLVLQLHYVPDGRPAKDRPSVSLRYSREPVQQVLHHLSLTDFEFVIPPFEPHFEVATHNTLPRAASVLWAFVHMHLRGKDATLSAKVPGSDAPTVLLRVPSYSFDWQTVYHWGKEMVLPTGTRIDLVTHFDNSRFHSQNPDASRSVKFGLEPTAEMVYGFLFYVDPNEHLDLTVDPKTGRANR